MNKRCLQLNAVYNSLSYRPTQLSQKWKTKLTSTQKSFNKIHVRACSTCSTWCFNVAPSNVFSWLKDTKIILKFGYDFTDLHRSTRVFMYHSTSLTVPAAVQPVISQPQSTDGTVAPCWETFSCRLVPWTILPARRCL